MSEHARHRIGVAAVTRDAQARILLIRTESAGLELPGGHVEKGEDFVSALVREVQEEANCRVEVGRLKGVTSSVNRKGLTVLTFLCRHVAGPVRAGDGSLGAGWFTPDEAVMRVTHPIERFRLSDALVEGEVVTYRAYRRAKGDGAMADRYDMLTVHRA